MKQNNAPSPVSVVIPLYNKEKYIGRTLAGVLAQTHGDFEVLVVDDGSSDHGPDYVEKCGDPRVRLLRFPNAGVSAARNRGVNAAKNPLVAFLDADDLWEPGFLKTMVLALESTPDAVASFCAIGEGGRGRTRMPHGERIIDDYPSWFIASGGRGMWSSNVVARAGDVKLAGGFPEGLQNGEDTDTWFRLSFRGPVFYVGDTLAFYVRDDPESLSRKIRAVEPRVIRTLELRLHELAEGSREARSARRAISYFHAAYALALAQEGRTREALREITAAGFAPDSARMIARTIVALATGR